MTADFIGYVLAHKMSFLWSVGDKSKLPQNNEENLTTKDKSDDDEENKSKSSTNASKTPPSSSNEEIKSLNKVEKQQPEISSKQSTSNKPNIKRKIQDDEDHDFEVEKTKVAKEESENDDEPDSLLATIVAAITPASIAGKKSVKRTLDSPDSSPSYHSDVKKSRNNEISSSFSSSNSVEFDEKVIKDNNKSNYPAAKIIITESTAVKESENSDTSNKKRKLLMFSKDLSPKKMLADLPSRVNNSVSKKSENTGEDSCHQEITDLKAFNEDQEKSEERGKQLMKAFEDD